MIQIEQVPYIPKLNYGDYAWKELRAAPEAIETVARASEGIWVVTLEEPVLVIGVIKNSLLSRPRLWFLLCRAFTETKVNYHLRALKLCLKTLDQHYPELETFVEEGWETGEKFARFCGFQPTMLRAEMYGKTFKVWRK